MNQVILDTLVTQVAISWSPRNIVASYNIYILYLSHFKSDFDDVKRKEKKSNQYHLTSYVAIHQIVYFGRQLFKSDFDGAKSKVGLWFTQLIQSKQLPNPIYQTNHSKPNLLNKLCTLGTMKPNLSNQIYLTKYTNWI